ncbi:MAG: tetratricopeptide repeat protein [Candidatus Syntrophosphaera sp.]|jgi:TolA-binding protein|nr:tetratricopeptide repeat protein [Candidatus Cloacimonadota bacterium]MDD5624280.1 tetratricopeptide repeat protein [Candidatus Cloacimonadota bacterium]MDY0112547.1 tetratricopeptide repeat protein [Candidatus Syntrophosphaera sp.]
MKRYFTLLIILLILTGCMETNTLYNARKYYKLAQSRPLNANGRPNNQAVEEYTKAIKKCGIILSRPDPGKEADDALFLMACALYYKGNSAFQAKDQFEALINNFPDSPYWGEAHIYLAKVYREINQKEEATKILEEFILNPEQKKLHPRALLTLAEFEIEDKNYIKAQYWLEKLITNYPKSKEYREAFFTFGKNYFIQKDYAKSLSEFEKIARDPRIPQSLKLEARYYIALNQFYLGDYDASWKTLQKLLKDENRPDKIAQARVLKARLLFARGDAEQGIAEVADITKSYPRTQSSAEANYYLGEYYFYQGGDLAKAMSAYNKVRTEFANSEFADIAQKKATSINFLQNNANLDPEQKLQDVIDYYMTAAEYYLNQFALPDSAIMMYQHLIDTKSIITARRDSLINIISEQQSSIDSLSALIENLPAISEEDSLNYSFTQMEIAPQDSLTAADSLSIADNMDYLTVSDSLMVEEEAINPIEQRTILEQSLIALQTELKSNQDRLVSLNEILERYENEIIPQALFSQAVVYQKIPGSTEQIQALYSRMSEEYPANKYTRALEQMLSGKPIHLIDPIEEEQYLLLEKALGYAETSPDSMLVILNELVNSNYPEIRLKANFRLGWYYTFEARDTTAAKPYLSEVLEYETDTEYAAVTAKFFDGMHFQLNRFDQLLLSFAELDTLKETSSAETEFQDTTEVQQEELSSPSLEIENDRKSINMSGNSDRYIFPQPESPEEPDKKNPFFIPNETP